MKMRMNFGWWKSAVIFIVILGAIAIIALDIVQLAGSEALRSANPVIAGVSLAAAVILLIAALLIFFHSYYRFDDDKLSIMLGFFCDKLPYSDVTGIKQNNVTKEVYVIYKNGRDESADEQSIRLNLSADKSEPFLAEMRKRCPFIIVEPFTPPEKKKKK